MQFFKNIICVFALAFILVSCTDIESHQSQINRYQFINNGENSFLLDSSSGSLWVLKKYKNEKPYILVPVPKISAKTSYQELIDLLPSDEVFNPEQDVVKSEARPGQSRDEYLQTLLDRYNQGKEKDEMKSGARPAQSLDEQPNEALRKFDESTKAKSTDRTANDLNAKIERWKKRNNIQ